jgi:hypothetical protein
MTFDVHRSAFSTEYDTGLMVHISMVCIHFVTSCV